MFSRYRNLAVLVVVVAAQLILLAFQVRTNQDVTLLRVWTVTAVSPLAKGLEALRSGTVGLFESYFVLFGVNQQNVQLRTDLDRLKLENQFLRTELATADRAKALAVFQERSRSRTVAARVIGTGTGANSKVVFIDRGKQDGVQRGMPVITPDGIVGKVTFVFPGAAQVLLITDPTFAAGVISQKNRVPGTLKGLGRSQVQVDWVQNEVKVEEGEWFFTSGDDRVFPKGLPAGQAKVVKSGLTFKEIYLDPSGLLRGLEEVLVVLEGVHAAIPEGDLPPEGPVFVMNPAPPETARPAAPDAPTPERLAPLSTDADRLREKIRRIGEVQGVQFGSAGSRLPNFNMDPAQVSRPAQPLFVAPAKPPEAKSQPARTPALAATQP
ncbi:MAG: rod shape-determining protein MreC [Acidobacteria bacterium]|nr:rod shape-determining protein MreC [Acidobacteriota bacterium]